MHAFLNEFWLENAVTGKVLKRKKKAKIKILLINKEYKYNNIAEITFEKKSDLVSI